MESVLEKTMHSLEAALRYNPTSVELMASLAEVSIRLGRFDGRTMELCEAVLLQQADNVLLQQAQSIGLLIEQSRALEVMLEHGETPPPLDAVLPAIDALDDFLDQSGDCVEAWVAWTRFQLLAGRLDRVTQGLETLKRLDFQEPEKAFHYTLRFSTRRSDLSAEQYRHLADIYLTLGNPSQAVRLLERLYDEGRTAVGPMLLGLYQKRYTPTRLEEVPVETRDRLLALLLDCAELETAGLWLRKAALLGWEVKSYTKEYARSLLADNALEDAFAILQRMALDAEAKALLNTLAERYEQRDEIDRAVAVLRYINDHELVAADTNQQSEHELVRDAELSMAELQFKSGRYGEALQRYVSALCLSPHLDPELLERIDEILKTSPIAEVEPLIRLGDYFRRQGDHPKALYYLNQAIDRNPDSKDALGELEQLFDEILQQNPDLPQLRLELGQLYLRTGRLDQAIEMLKEAAKIPNLAQQANRLLARAYAGKGKMTEALEKYRTQTIEEEDFENLYAVYEEMVRRQAPREALLALGMIAKANPAWRDVSEKVRQLEESTGKAQGQAEAAVADPKMRELIGDQANGRYQHLDLLGSGGMGVVHKVYDLRHQRVVAMKILRDTLSGSSKALDRFFREARIAATLRHRNIVNIYDYNISNLSGQSYIVMEFVDGPSLRELTDRQFQSTMSITMDYITEILHYATQLCDALEASHAKGIIHRDIKPDNIMITSQGLVKITDFGIVHVEEATFTPTGAMLGTPRYMSPEQVTGGKIDGRSDIYSVGILLYEVLVGSPPFMTGDVAYQQVHNAPVPPREINPMIPQGVAEVILKCLAKKPEERFLNAHMLKSALSEQLDNLGGCSKFENATCAYDCTEVDGINDELDLD